MLEWIKVKSACVSRRIWMLSLLPNVHKRLRTVFTASVFRTVARVRCASPIINARLLSFRTLRMISHNVFRFAFFYLLTRFFINRTTTQKNTNRTGARIKHNGACVLVHMWMALRMPVARDRRSTLWLRHALIRTVRARRAARFRFRFLHRLRQLLARAIRRRSRSSRISSTVVFRYGFDLIRFDLI